MKEQIYFLVTYTTSVIVGYLTFSLTSAKHTGEKNKFDILISKLTGHDINTSLKYTSHVITLENSRPIAFYVHVHHWLYLSCIFLTFDNIYVKGFCFGGIAQGILHYEDWHHVLGFKEIIKKTQ
jgi:hypothetical protein